MPEYNSIWLCGVYVLVLVLSGLGYVASGPQSVMCYDCHHVKHPNDCKLITKCDPDQMCATSVHARGPNHDDIEVSLHCRDEDLCPGHRAHLVSAILGKKRGNPHHHLPDGHDLVCDECCRQNTLCNADLCAVSIYGPPPTVATTSLPTTTTTVATTTTTTAASAPSTAPVYDPDCRDHEEDGFACPMLDLFNLCSDSSTLSYVIAHEKCKRHCGFCTPDPNAPVVLAATPPPRGVCANYEQDGFKCASMDLFKLCTDPSSLAYVLARQKCPEHCGFCPKVSSGVQSQTAVTSSAALSAATTAAPFIASTTMAPTAATAVPPSTIGAPAASPAAAASAVTKLPVFTATAVSSGVQSQTAVTSSAALSAATTAAPFIASTTMAPTAATAVPPSTIGASAASPLLPHVTQTVATQAPAAAASAVTQLPVFTATAACKNVEENGFNCLFMDALSICTEPTFQTIAREKCSKHCGFCT